ncbi:MAG TPA: FecR family protein [Flavihumibacter sp.]|nr:FecR family protein [Flavihumibacter sp.]
MQDRLWELLSKKLAGEATRPELDELQQLLRQSPDLHYPLQTITDLWFQQSPQAEDAEAAFGRHLQRMDKMGLSLPSAAEPMAEEPTIDNEPMVEEPTVRRRPHFRTALVLTLLGVTLAGIWWLAQPSVRNHQLADHTQPAVQSEISTRDGSRSKVLLPDGSQVWLNSGSKITYGKDFNTTLREVHLTGEAFFDVVKDTAHPFVIHARNIDIRVVGTAFNVRSYPEDKTVETSLIRGIIEVNVHNRPKEKFILKPSEKLVVAADDSLRLPTRQQGQPKMLVDGEPKLVLGNIHYQPVDSLVVETSWLENKLSFMDESFRDLANRMERWYGVKIKFDNQRLEKIRFTGTFEHETLQQALRALTITASFNYRISENEVTIYR